MTIDLKHRQDYAIADCYLRGDKQAGYELYADVLLPIRPAFVFVHKHTQHLPKTDKEDIVSEAMITNKVKLESITALTPLLLTKNMSPFGSLICMLIMPDSCKVLIGGII